MLRCVKAYANIEASEAPCSFPSLRNLASVTILLGLLIELDNPGISGVGSSGYKRDLGL
jgi:hypothetical protein